MSAQHPTVMIVEDETLLLEAITKKLKLENIETISCNSGHQAFDYLANLPELPDVVWLDYYLKDMNGLDFMNTLKANPKWEHIPVVVVSNSASPDKVNTMLGLGASQYLLKAEHRLDELVKVMRDFIMQNQPGRQSPTQTQTLPTPNQTQPSTTPPTNSNQTQTIQ